jgi:hypothetical protein
MLLSSVAELLTLASLFPFLAVLSDPNKALQLGFVARLSQLFGVGSTSNLLVALTFLVAVAALAAAAIRTANLYYTGRLAALIGNDLSVDAKSSRKFPMPACSSQEFYSRCSAPSPPRCSRSPL